MNDSESKWLEQYDDMEALIPVLRDAHARQDVDTLNKTLDTLTTYIREGNDLSGNPHVPGFFTTRVNRNHTMGPTFSPVYADRAIALKKKVQACLAGNKPDETDLRDNDQPRTPLPPTYPTIGSAGAALEIPVSEPDPLPPSIKDAMHETSVAAISDRAA